MKILLAGIAVGIIMSVLGGALSSKKFIFDQLSFDTSATDLARVMQVNGIPCERNGGELKRQVSCKFRDRYRSYLVIADMERDRIRYKGFSFLDPDPFQ